MAMELLLAHADDASPVLRRGLPEEALNAAPRPMTLPKPEKLWNVNGDTDELPRQRWGVIVPEGPRGEHLLQLIEPLRRKRQKDQRGADVRIHRVAPGMDGPSAARWKKRIFRDEAVHDKERPRYLLLLGDLDQVSLETQQVLSAEALVGRLAFPTDAGYEAYVAKVLRWEDTARTREAQPRLLFYTARDGTDATEYGHRLLVEPGMEACRRQRDFQSVQLINDESVPGERLLSCAAERESTVLFSMSHGLGRPEGGWNSLERQRQLQGAVLLPGKGHLTAADIASRPFLPGGFWFCFACFSAGTPARSTYEPWLRQLAASSPDAARILASLPRLEEPPFIAALPQAALANPEGPLAVVGHVDLAWSYSFSDQGRGTPSRLLGVLEALAEGRRVGSAFLRLARFLNNTDNELTTLYLQEQMARSPGMLPRVDPAEFAALWMLRQDLANYMLLGDPAVRLPLDRAA